jgi:hypothetical protein
LVESAAAVVADFANASLAFRDGAAMAAGKTAEAIVLELLVETRIGFANLLVEDGTKGGHGLSFCILTLLGAICG